MVYTRFLHLVILWLGLTPWLSAGIYYRGEEYAPLPSQWRGFLVDLRALRMIGVEAKADGEFNPLRAQYRDAAQKLEAISPRSLRDSVDLAAVYLRLNQSGKAVELLRPLRRQHPDDFPLAANLACAWMMSGDLPEAIRTQRDAIRLAPPADKAFEEVQLRWMLRRQDEPRNSQQQDALFKGEIPKDEIAWLQRLALSFPVDARLIWLLAERTQARGDVRSAAMLMDVAVVELAFTAPAARENRKEWRLQADRISELPDSEHAKYRGDIVMQSPRPLRRRPIATELPAIRADRTNLLPWPVVTETRIEKPFRPVFHDYLRQLDGKQVSVTGYMQPLSPDIEVVGFMCIEFPVGCWFCEVPEPSGIIYVELPAGKSATVRKNRVKVTGTLKLNLDEPEDFLYSIRKAQIADPD